VAAGAEVAPGAAAVAAGALVGDAAGAPPQAPSKLAIIASPTKVSACFLMNQPSYGYRRSGRSELLSAIARQKLHASKESDAPTARLFRPVSLKALTWFLRSSQFPAYSGSRQGKTLPLKNW
jgi:hypothetical protein